MPERARWFAVILTAVLAAGCAGVGKERAPSDLRDAPAPSARPAAARASRLPALLSARPADKRRQAFAEELAAWNLAIRRLIDASGGFSELPESLRVRIALRLSVVQAYFERDAKGELKPRPSRLKDLEPREMIEWISPVDRFFQNALRQNPSLPEGLRAEAQRRHDALEKLAWSSAY